MPNPELYPQTDEEFGKANNAALVGTTAVVALVGDRQLYIGNCGAPPTSHALISHTVMLEPIPKTV